MIHEYAIEPRLIAMAGERSRYRFWTREFGLGTPRIMAQLPKLTKWKSQVLKALDSDLGEIEQARVVELIQYLSSNSSMREGAAYDGSQPWIDNALTEHQRQPFQAILATTNSKEDEAVLVSDPPDSIDDAAPLWLLPRGVCVSRKASDMAAAVGCMLRSCREVVFIDPYFRSSNPRHYRVMEKLLCAIAHGRVAGAIRRLEICSGSDPKIPSIERLEQEFRRGLAKFLEPNTMLTLRKLTQKSGGEKLHNRYILTDLGGVQFGIGLDDGEEGETDDVTLLEKDQYLKRWSQYCRNTLEFDCEEKEITV